MSNVPDFDELIGADVPAEERARLRRAHDALLRAGPPPELPASLELPPDPEPRVSFLPQRRRFTLLGLAAALALVAFGGGWLAGGKGGDFHAAFTRPMHGTALAPTALATIRIADADSAGNWPMRFSVNGLEPLPKGAYYELYLSRRGKPIAQPAERLRCTAVPRWYGSTLRTGYARSTAGSSRATIRAVRPTAPSS